MESSVVVGVIGLASALLGAGVTFAGIVYQQRHQARVDREAQRQALATAAVERVLGELSAIQRIVRRSTRDLTAEEAEERRLRLHDHVASILLEAQRIPDPRVRDRVRENASFVLLSPPEDPRTPDERRMDGMWVCGDSIGCLGAYLREEPLPGRLSPVQELIDRWPTFRGGTDWFMEP
ncbi:hypothetical protein OG612_32765 [Streptomyces sp. NBC_01527]|uniref:hypothetical protein n=1 Tax=unclassified Streptomyces TaxID=2593676 RepID=UPI002E11A893|nr:hypothetical protein OG763_10600 [Streptomyces sp. NBC_01230]